MNPATTTATLPAAFPFAAIWHGPDYDEPVTVIGELGLGSDQRSYIRTAQTQTGLPVGEMECLDAAGALWLAQSYVRAGLCVLLVLTDGSKKPDLKTWAAFQRRPPTANELHQWFAAELRGLAIVCGKVSGNLEAVDVDDAKLVAAYFDLIEECAPGLLARLIIAETPRGGRHLIYRCAEIAGNQKLALRPAADDPRKAETLIETRGEGGYIIAPGSPAACHPTGRTYRLLQGSFDATPTLTPEERAILLDCARSLNEHIKPSQQKSEPALNNGLKPGDAFNQRGDVRALLAKYGWRQRGKSHVGERWIRPDGDRPSATLFNESGKFYVFSTNAAPLEFDRAYSPFSLLAQLEHGGDYKAAAKALAAQGYGTPAKPPQLISKQSVAKPATALNEEEQTADETPDDVFKETFFEGRFTLEARRVGRNKFNVEVANDDGVIHQDLVDLTRDDQRARFARRLNLEGAEAEEVKKALLRAAKEINQAPQGKPRVNTEEVDLDGQYCPYRETNSGLFWLKPISGSGERDGLTQPVTLTNFSAQIACNVIRDDGTEPAHHFEVEVKLAGEQAVHKGLVKAAEFDLMRWPVVVAGARAVIYAGKSDHARTAIQLLSSRTAQTRRIVTHTGWRNDGGGWRFYHAGGAITARGAEELDVELAGSLTNYSLPAPPTGARLREVVRALAFDLPKVAPEQISLPLIGCVPVAILTGADFSLFLIGTTGTGKSELLALLMNCFGKEFNRKNLPAYWESTPLSIQEVAHLAKDVTCGVDDFVPKGTAIAQARLHDKAEIVFRGQGNGSGRGRCNSDGSLRPARPSRGLIVSTGEDVPRGQSLQARLLISQVEKPDVRWDEITACQKQARAGVYAEATSAFIQWLATADRIERYRQDAAEKLHELRAGWLESGVDAHKKTATTLAYLQRAWDVWLEFAAECEALDGDEIIGIRESVHDALDALGRAQSRYLLSENPATRFIELLRSALVSGQAHMAATDGGKPEAELEQAFGWRQGEPLGAMIGWVDGENVYLQPDAAHRIAQAASVSGEGLSVSAQTLWKRMKEEKLLASTDEKRETNTVRRTICGKSESVIHLPLKLFFSAGVG